MKSFLSKILMLSLLCFTALASVARETAPESCWFDTTKDTSAQYGNVTRHLNSYCSVPYSSADYYIGKVIDDDGAPECHYVSPGRAEGYVYDVRWLVTNYETLKDIIKKHGKLGKFHENIDNFHNRFPECTTSTQGHTPVITQGDNNPGTALTQPSSYREVCLSDETLTGGGRGIKIGYWQAGQCQTNDNSPFYPKKQKEQPKASDGCPEYNPVTEFSCEGYDFYRRGWAEECLSAFGAKSCYESTNCKKKRTQEECCKFAHDENCETVSMDTKGKCCCGVRLNKDNDKCRNVGLRRK
ncbi:hypothetical protein [Endozoicomonas lisbonensis]|uniref:Uncharacterized protein n=1 Tax=Endozoicomonas lisbonensis TaxID=3120522 RepID=A0ABV2SKX1_9GAMM